MQGSSEALARIQVENKECVESWGKGRIRRTDSRTQSHTADLAQILPRTLARSLHCALRLSKLTP